MNLESLKLGRGNHPTPEAGLCVMEAVAMFAKEPHSDDPACSSRVISRFAMSLNDRWSESDRQLLKPFIPRIVGTRGDVQLEIRLAYLCADWVIRECLPLACDAAGATNWAELLRSLPEVMDERSAREAQSVADFCREDLRADAATATAADAATATADADAAAYAAYADATDSRDYALMLLGRLCDVAHGVPQ